MIDAGEPGAWAKSNGPGEYITENWNADEIPTCKEYSMEEALR